MSSGPAWDKDVLYLDTTRARTGAAAIADGLVPADDLDGLEALLVDLHHDRGFAKPRKGSGAAYSKRHTRAAVWDRRQQLYDALGEFERAPTPTWRRRCRAICRPASNATTR